MKVRCKTGYVNGLCCLHFLVNFPYYSRSHLCSTSWVSGTAPGARGVCTHLILTACLQGALHARHRRGHRGREAALAQGPWESGESGLRARAHRALRGSACPPSSSLIQPYYPQALFQAPKGQSSGQTTPCPHGEHSPVRSGHLTS